MYVPYTNYDFLTSEVLKKRVFLIKLVFKYVELIMSFISIVQYLFHDALLLL